ncbi:MAG: hypothetical protein WBL21_00155 [Salinimicrobium sp.]
MNREFILLQLIISAVATVVIPYLVACIYKRILKVRILLKQMDLFYIDMVENDRQLPEFARQLMEEKYNRERPTALVLFFSRKPLEVFTWFPLPINERIDSANAEKPLPIGHGIPFPNSGNPK